MPDPHEDTYGRPSRRTGQGAYGAGASSSHEHEDGRGAASQDGPRRPVPGRRPPSVVTSMATFQPLRASCAYMAGGDQGGELWGPP